MIANQIDDRKGGLLMMDIRQRLPGSWQQYTIMHLNRRAASIQIHFAAHLHALSSRCIRWQSFMKMDMKRHSRPT